ncbi:MAG: hypothetical protein ABFS46_18145 [Myxococcota bacterium]
MGADLLLLARLMAFVHQLAHRDRGEGALPELGGSEELSALQYLEMLEDPDLRPYIWEVDPTCH